MYIHHCLNINIVVNSKLVNREIFDVLSMNVFILRCNLELILAGMRSYLVHPQKCSATLAKSWWPTCLPIE